MENKINISVKIFIDKLKANIIHDKIKADIEKILLKASSKKSIFYRIKSLFK